jgi:DNA primase
MDFSVKVENFERYLELYHRGTRVADIPPLSSQTYKIFKSSPVDIRVINRDKNYDIITFLKKIEYFCKDSYKSNRKFFYMIPLQSIKGTIVGFVFRTLFEKHYATIHREYEKNKVPALYGLYPEFKNFDSNNNAMPIVVCEGAKDCIALKKIYPYVIANNTSKLGINAYVLRNLTNKFILAYDNDETGTLKTDYNRKQLQSLGAYVGRLRIPANCKDCGDCTDKKSDWEELKKNLKKEIRILVNS